MANKSVLIGGRTVNVKGRSAFDKSFLNALTSGVGTITPIFKKLVIPSSGRVTLSAHAELPPLATDAYLRSHLKIEAFYTPCRLLYGGFQSWFSGELVYDHLNDQFVRSALPCAFVPSYLVDESDQTNMINVKRMDLNRRFGAGSLTDYFNVKLASDSVHNTLVPFFNEVSGFSINPNDFNLRGCRLNIFPYLNYHLLYHHFYRNKSVQRPVFSPVPARTDGDPFILHAYSLPFSQDYDKCDFVLGSNSELDTQGDVTISDAMVSSALVFSDGLLDGSSLCELRQRNYGDDYFTCARPQAQAGNPVNVQVDQNGKFSIASLRLQNALQEFAENQSYATPDYVQTNMARYGVSVSNGVVQKPVILGSADFPMFTKPVELNAQTTDASARNPFSASGMLGSVAGRASANGIDFSFDFDAKEVGYIMVLATLVPEANYATGIDHDMRIFVSDGDLTDLPCSLLEHVGDEPIWSSELYSGSNDRSIFGYVQRYLWHKAGSGNQIHGLFRKGENLESFIPQRNFGSRPEISSSFLEIPKTALDDVASVSAGVSHYGVMLDCSFNVHISEPLSESALPSLSDPAREHGREVYLSNGGSKL